MLLYKSVFFKWEITITGKNKEQTTCIEKVALVMGYCCVESDEQMYAFPRSGPEKV